MNLLNTKKGQIMNYMVVIVTLFVFGFMSLIAAVLMNGVIDGFTTAGLYTDEIESTGNKFLSAILLFDKVILFIAVGFIISVGLTSFKLATPPAFFIISFIMAGFYGWISYFFNYIFYEIASNTVFAAVTVSFPWTLILCTNLHWIALVIFIVGSVTLYAKRDTSQIINE